jgi:hypothetical protein
LRAFNELLCNRKGKVKKGIEQNLGSVITAVEMLDDQFNTTRHKISLRRRHLVNLTVVISLCLMGMVGLSAGGVLSGPLASPVLLLATMLTGALGASLSVAQSIMSSSLESRIPAQIVGSFLVWMRPVVGAAAATAAALITQLNEIFSIFNPKLLNTPSVILSIALIAGFSERFIVGTIEQFSERIQSQSGSRARSTS